MTTLTKEQRKALAYKKYKEIQEPALREYLEEYKKIDEEEEEEDKMTTLTKDQRRNLAWKKYREIQRTAWKKYEEEYKKIKEEVEKEIIHNGKKYRLVEE